MPNTFVGAVHDAQLHPHRVDGYMYGTITGGMGSDFVVFKQSLGKVLHAGLHFQPILSLAIDHTYCMSLG